MPHGRVVVYIGSATTHTDASWKGSSLHRECYHTLMPHGRVVVYIGSATTH